MERKRELVEQRGQGLKQFSGRLSKTANIVAFANSRSKHRSENLLQLSSQVQNLTPQLVNAGTIKMNYPENKAADENFENLRKQYAAGVQTIRDFCDEAIDIRTFLKQTSDHIQVWSSLILSHFSMFITLLTLYRRQLPLVRTGCAVSSLR